MEAKRGINDTRRVQLEHKQVVWPREPRQGRFVRAGHIDRAVAADVERRERGTIGEHVATVVAKRQILSTRHKIEAKHHRRDGRRAQTDNGRIVEPNVGAGDHQIGRRAGALNCRFPRRRCLQRRLGRRLPLPHLVARLDVDFRHNRVAPTGVVRVRRSNQVNMIFEINTRYSNDYNVFFECEYIGEVLRKER
jgi:hypothetical protein